MYLTGVIFCDMKFLINIYHFHGYFNKKSYSIRLDKQMRKLHFRVIKLKLTVIFSLHDPKAQVAFVRCLSSWFYGSWGFTFLLTCSVAVFTWKDYYRHSLGKYSNYILFNITCKSFSWPLNIVLCTYNIKRKLVDLFCYNALHLRIILKECYFHNYTLHVLSSYINSLLRKQKHSLK